MQKYNYRGQADALFSVKPAEEHSRIKMIQPGGGRQSEDPTRERGVSSVFEMGNHRHMSSRNCKLIVFLKHVDTHESLLQHPD